MERRQLKHPKKGCFTSINQKQWNKIRRITIIKNNIAHSINKIEVTTDYTKLHRGKIFNSGGISTKNNIERYDDKSIKIITCP